MSWNEICHDAFAHFSIIDPVDLVGALRHRFDVEHISRYFRSEEYSFSGTALDVRPDNSILMEFATLQSEHPDLYPAKQYRLLLVLALHREESITTSLSLELNTVRRKDNIDRIVVWSCNGFDAPTLHSLKTNAIDVISIAERDVAAASSISHYIPIDGKDHNYAPVALHVNLDKMFGRRRETFTAQAAWVNRC